VHVHTHHLRSVHQLHSVAPVSALSALGWKLTGELDLSSCLTGVGDIALLAASLSKLTSLKLHHATAAHDDLSSLTQLTSLTALQVSLSGHGFDHSSNLRAIAGFRGQLRALTLLHERVYYGLKASRSALSALSALTGLTRLSSPGFNLFDPDWGTLQHSEMEVARGHAWMDVLRPMLRGRALRALHLDFVSLNTELVHLLAEELATEATQRASVQDSSSRCSASGYRQPYVLEEVGISFALLEPIWQRQLSLNASRVSGLAHVERLLLHLKKFGSWCGLVPALETLPGFVPPMSPVQEGASMQWVAFAAMDGHIHFGWIAGWPLAWLQSLGPRMLKHAPMSHTFLLQLPEPPCGGREHIEQG